MRKQVKIIILCIFLIIIFGLVYFRISSIPNNASKNEDKNTMVNENNDTDEKYIKKIKESNIYKYLPNNINSITRNSYFSDEVIAYQINNYLSFLSDFVSIEWTPTNDTVDDDYYYIIDINGDTVTHIKLFKNFTKDNQENFAEYTGYAKVYGDDFEQLYTVDQSLIYKCLNYTNDKILLYESEISEPSKEKCLNAQTLVLEKMSKEATINFQNRVRNLHSYLENMLKNQTDISDPTSPYWDLYITDNSVVEDIISKEKIATSDVLSQKINEFNDLANLSNNDILKKDFKNAANYIEQAKKEHSRLYIYYAYQIIHDYDFFIINYPPYQNFEGGQNYSGIHTYFGKDNLILN